MMSIFVKGRLHPLSWADYHAVYATGNYRFMSSDNKSTAKAVLCFIVVVVRTLSARAQPRRACEPA